MHLGRGNSTIDIILNDTLKHKKCDWCHQHMHLDIDIRFNDAFYEASSPQLKSQLTKINKHEYRIKVTNISKQNTNKWNINHCFNIDFTSRSRPLMNKTQDLGTKFFNNVDITCWNLCCSTKNHDVGEISYVYSVMVNLRLVCLKQDSLEIYHDGDNYKITNNDQVLEYGNMSFEEFKTYFSSKEVIQNHCLML